jgi:hypothetical protein
MDNKDIESGIANKPTLQTKNNTKSWVMRIMSVLLTDKALRMRGGKRAGSSSSSSSSSSDYYEIV